MNKIFGYLFLLTTLNTHPINFKEYFIDILKEDPIPFELPIYELLKKYPIKKDLTYIAIPWARLQDGNRLHRLPKIYIKNSFTVTRSLKFEEMLPAMKKMGITTLFCPHAVGKKYEGIKVIAMPHYNMNGVFANEKKDIFYSFIGCNDHITRNMVFNMHHPQDACIIKRKTLHFFIDKWEKGEEAKIRKEEEKKEYQNILSRSRYSLCLSGYGPGTLRFWESLQAQAIPVLVTDIELPKHFDWGSCIVKIKEEELPNIASILSNIDPQKEAELKENCLKAYKRFCGDNIISVIKDYYKGL